MKLFRGDAKLLDFQAEDLEQLKSRKSRLVGSDPGTGKTFVGIALDLTNRRGDGHPKVQIPRYAKTLIVAPKSVLSTWEEHCQELTDLPVCTLDTTKQPKKARDEFLEKLCDSYTKGYFICHWEAIRNLESTLTKKKVVFFHIIGDEIHRAKNRKAQQTIALKKLQTWYKTGMSGTPADNRPQDLWSILHWLWPNYYTSFWKFVNTYLITETTDEGYRKFVGVNTETIKTLRQEMKNWYVRRRKEDVLPDLPSKYYSRVWVTLDPKQRRAYDEMRKTMIAWVDEHEMELTSPLIAQAAVAQLTRLQQFADGYMIPRRDENGEHMFVWRWPKGTSKEWKKEFAPTDADPDKPLEGGATKSYLWDMTEPAAKLDALMDIIEDRMEYNEETGKWEGEQIVVFSQSKQAIRLLEKRLVRKKIPHGIYTGDVPEADRTQIRHSFQNGDLRVFAGTTKAGGVGLTLTAASTVIFIDRDWSPSINGQAEDRLHRIGQKNAVQVIDLMARNTVDLGKKQQLSLKAKHLQMLLGDKVEPELVLADLEAEEKSAMQVGLEALLAYTDDDEGEEDEGVA